MITPFLLALQFLTVIPFRIKLVDDRKIAASMVYFPLVGILLGLALIGLNNLAVILNFPLISTNIILIVSLVILTGGIHLDGLSDTLDGFLGGKNKEEILAIMKDPHIGVMGALGIFSILLLKLAFFLSIESALMPQALILMCCLARWSLVFCSFLFPYARQDGKAKIYVQGVNLKILIFTAIITLMAAIIFGGIKGVSAFVIVTAITYFIGSLINKKISGITGDTLGALCEFNEVIVLFVISLMAKI